MTPLRSGSWPWRYAGQTVEFNNSCRSEYGPLGLRIQATVSSNGFTKQKVSDESQRDVFLRSGLEMPLEAQAQAPPFVLTQCRKFFGLEIWAADCLLVGEE